MKRVCVIVLITILLLPLDVVRAQNCGCNDPQASNYNSAATCNDGSCTYASASVAVSFSVNLPSKLDETSGMVYWNKLFWTHTDSGGSNSIYSFSDSNVNALTTYNLPNTANVDWEEISQDDDYLYVGDFGNNGAGNRTDLKIYRISKSSLLANSPMVDVINFSYANQTDFTPKSGNATDFDCEAFVVTADSIVLFTKQWESKQTTIYTLPKTPGTYKANAGATFNVGGLITGATYLPTKRLVLLCGYSTTLSPFLVMLYDFTGTNFFSGNKRIVSISESFHQVEAISTTDGLTCSITNEKFSYLIVNTPARYQKLDLSKFLSSYFSTITACKAAPATGSVSVSPNPAQTAINIQLENGDKQRSYQIINAVGQPLLAGIVSGNHSSVNIEKLNAGIYFLKTDGSNGSAVFVKK